MALGAGGLFEWQKPVSTTKSENTPFGKFVGCHSG